MPTNTSVTIELDNFDKITENPNRFDEYNYVEWLEIREKIEGSKSSFTGKVGEVLDHLIKKVEDYHTKYHPDDEVEKPMSINY